MKLHATFAIFAYNQESYIREAVNSALGQAGVNLEIIISDDCSTDNTFSIIQDAVKEYRGEHCVKINKNEKNLGLSRHIKKVSNMASTEIIIMAAGDDVSLLNRSEEVVRLFDSDKSVSAVFSGVEVIDGSGSIIESLTPKSRYIKKYFIEDMSHGAGGIGLGAAYAYAKKCFDWPHEIPDFIDSEDRLLPFRAALLGTVVRLESSLVHYRRTEGGLSSVLSTTNTLAYQNQRHIEELKRTLDLAVTQRLISINRRKTNIRILENMPLEHALFRRINCFKSEYVKVILYKLVAVWFSREKIVQKINQFIK